MTRLAILLMIGSFAVAGNGCGKKSPVGGTPLAAPPKLEAASVGSVAGTTDLPSVLADIVQARDKLVAAMRAERPELAEATGGEGLLSLFMTPAAWEAAGLDPRGELAVSTDRRVALAGDDGPMPLSILIVPVVDRAKFLAVLARDEIGVTLGDKVGSVESLMHGTETVAWMGAYGDRVAIAMVPAMDTTTVRAGFEQFLAGDGAALADADAFNHAMKDGPSGPGVYFWLSDLRQLGWLGQLVGLRRRDREHLLSALPIQIDAVGLRVGRGGVSLRTVPTASTHASFEALYRGNASPKDVGRVVPARGWAVGRISLDFDSAVPVLLAMFGQSESQAQRVLGQVGLSWDEIKGALSGEIGGAIEVASTLATFQGAGMPSWIGILGVNDAERCDALVDKLVTLASMSDRFGRRDVTVNGQKAIVLERGAQAFVIARHDDLLLVTPSELSMASALERADGDNLSKTRAGEALRERLVLAAVVDAAPLVSWIEGLMRYKDADGRAMMAATSAEAFRADPIVTLRTGFDGDAQLSTVDDKGLTYALLVAGVVMSLVQMTARAPAGIVEGVGGLPRSCELYLETMSRCLEMMPTADQRDGVRDALRTLGDGWRKDRPPELDSTCRQVYAASRSSMSDVCPKVEWPALD